MQRISCIEVSRFMDIGSEKIESMAVEAVERTEEGAARDVTTVPLDYPQRMYKTSEMMPSVCPLRH